MRSPVRLRFTSSFSLAAAAAGSLLLSACGGVGDADGLFNSGGMTSGGGGATSTSASSGKASSSGATMASSTSSGASSGTLSGTSSSGTSSSGTSSGTSSSGTSSSGTSSSGTSSSSASSSGSGTMVENCLDGIDNNGDGLVDCADPQCQAGFQCVDDSPPNWKGPFYVTQTALPSGPAPLCGPTLNPFTEFAVPAGPAQCTACSCSALQGAACSAPGITCWPGSTNCNGGAGQNWTPALMDGACHKPSNLLGFNFSLSCQISSLPALVSAGTCAPSAVDFPNKALWQQRIDACGASKLGGGCGPNKACVPKGSGGPTESVCVRADGMNACPAGWSKTINAYTDAIDTRACGACTCGVPMAKCSDASYTFYDFDQCMVGAGSSNPIPVNSNACTDVSGQLDQGSWSVNGQLSKPIGSCPPSGGAPTGSVQPQKPVTYCCK